MNIKKYVLRIDFLIIVAFLALSCSAEKSSQSDNSQSGKELKAKIVYFSIPG